MELGDYTLEQVLHEGLETRVCRGVHRPSGARVAIKLPVAESPSPRVLGRIIHEHHVLTQLTAVPGVARPRELVQQGGTAMLVLEDPGLRSLDRVLADRGRLSVEAGLTLGCLLSQVLADVHAASVMHKDVKPQNVLVDEEFEQIMLLDFGIASALAQEATEASIPEALEGTLAYISPEQTGRTARALDARTDIYSLGATLFEMLSGRRPFLERDSLALVHAHLAKEPPALTDVAPEVPKTVAAIVGKMLAKDPEQRYQTAKGAAEDLAEALRQWRERGAVDGFALGRKDFSRKLRLPQSLVGREHEVEQVAASFTEAATGGVTLLLIGGPSGIGKTALVRSVYRDIAQAGRGLLIAGKHDQLARSTPFAAMAQAFGALMRQWLASPESVLAAWRERIRSQVGDNARVIADVVPELDLVMGKLAPVPPVHGDQVLNRQKLTWLNFVRAVTTPNPPLVMFLDDMQWVDTATLLILQTLLTDVERKELLVIAAYRDNEAPPEHPMWKLVEAANESGAKVSQITVGPLLEEHVHQWMARTLSSEPKRVEPLARALWQKTRGNPFFLEQLLLSLHRQKQVTRDLESGEWRWNQDELMQAQVTDNVVTLLTNKVREMPEATQQLLGLAACAGHQFQLQDLERLSGWERARVTSALWPALEEELVVPVDGAYRPAQALGDAGAGALDASFRFLHDRVQQASYERISPEQRVLAHLEIGRRLLRRYRSEGGTPHQLLELARHLNLGAPQMDSPDERKDVAKVNLDAARAAKAASSHRLMANLIEGAEALLGEKAWQEEPALSVELALERLEAAFLLREFDDVEARAVAFLALPMPALPRLAAHEVRVRSYVATGQFARGEELGLAALAEQGLTFPQTEDECRTALMKEANELDQWFEQEPNAFDEMPPDPSLEHLLIDALVAQSALSAGFGGRPMLSMLGIARTVSEARRHRAITPIAPFMIGTFGQLWSTLTGMYHRSARWVELGLRAATRVASPMLAECLCYQGIYMVYFHKADASAPIYEETTATGLKSGSFQGTSWGLFCELSYYRAWRGLPLTQVNAQQKARWGLMQRSGDTVGRHVFELTASWCDLLMNPGSSKRLLVEDPLSRGSRSFIADGDGLAAEFARIVEAHLFLIVGAFPAALSRAREAEQFRPIIYGASWVTDVPLWLALSAAKCFHATTDPDEKAKLREHIEHGITRLTYFGSGCADNFLHKLRLIEAEYARVLGKTEEAMTKYGEAIELAREHRFLHVEALAAQLCAEFHLEASRTHVGALYLREARDAYTRWGALAVVVHLEAKYPTLIKPPVAITPTERTTVTVTTTTTNTTGNVHLDAKTAVRAAQALSSELDPTRVVGRLMELVLENAGAERGVLLLRTGESLSVVARLSVDQGNIETGLSEPLDDAHDLAKSVVQFVARATEPVVTGNANADARFADDPYLASRSVLSILALPLTHRGHLVGVLYLEHRDAASSFPPARVELLSVIASQAAIAVENALLYQDLEAKVKERTVQLRIAKDAADRANQAKSDFLSSMSHELRTPLNSILGYAQILERSADVPVSEKEGVRVIRTSGEHLLALINDVLNLAKIEAGKMDLVIKEVHFSSFVKTVASLCRIRAEQKGIEFRCVQSGPDLHVRADETRLMQVLLNLLGNAIKFTSQGSVTLSATVLDRSPHLSEGDSTERMIRFQIVDTGPGIAPEDLGRIFEPFEQVGDEKARREGTGLGLSITKSLVERMGGRIEVTSELGKGSVFTVTMRVPEVTIQEAAGDERSWSQIAGYKGERRQLLLVDDNADNRAVLRGLLLPIGFIVLEAESGEQALSLAALHKPALVLTDVAMPGMDGFETTRRLRQIPGISQAIVIASSASVSEEQVQKSIAAGCNDFLPKPIKAGPLLEKLERHLGLSWIRKEQAEAPPSAQDSEASELVSSPRPSSDELNRLIELVQKGRLGNLLEMVQQMEQADSRLGPWLRQVRALAKGYELKKLRELLLSQSTT